MNPHFICPNWSAPSNVVACTTTRVAGVSQAPFDSFNLATHVGDKPQSVCQNRQRFVDACNLPAQPCWLEQVHGIRVIRVGGGAKISAGDATSNIHVADGSITSEPNVVCAVMTADCMPLFLANQNGDRVGVIHAGWRGMADGIIEQAVSEFDQTPEQIIAWAGPTIGPDRFEVGAEVKAQLGGAEEAYLQSSRQGKYFANLYRLAEDRLAALGVHNFSHGAYCTYNEPEKFYSYRRSGVTGRMASVIYFSE